MSWTVGISETRIPTGNNILPRAGYLIELKVVFVPKSPDVVHLLQPGPQ
jgi:hypothetical protein